MHEYLAAFQAAGRTEGVLFIGRAQEKNTVFRTEKRRADDGRSYPWIVKTTSVVNQFYVHCVDEDFGAFFIKFSSYFPYGAKLLINGHHYAQAQAARAGIGFTALDNGFAACDDVAGLQAICDSLTEDKIEALARKWLAILPNPYSPADQAAGYCYDISVLQAEFSLTQVLDKPVTGRIFFDQVIHDNLVIGLPDQVGLVFGRRIQRGRKRPTPGRFRTRVITDGVTPSLHVDYKNAKIKQYHKLGKAIRTETTVNDTRDFGVGRRLTNLPALRQIGFSANRRLLGAQILSHDPIAGADALAQVTDPVITPAGTRVAGLRLTDPRALALPPAPASRTAHAGHGGGASRQPFGPDGLPAPFAHPVPALRQPPQRVVDRRHLFPRRLEQRGGVLPLERERRALRVVLVVGPGRASRLGQPGELPLQRGHPQPRPLPLAEQHLPRRLHAFDPSHPPPPPHP